jgi:Tol biopolymer transport system component
MLLIAATSWSRSNVNRASVLGGPDVGGKIAYARSGALWLYRGGEAKQLTAGPANAQDKRDAFPSFSPDGTQLAYTRIDEGFSDLYTLDISDPGNPIALTDYRPTAEVGQVEIPGVSEGYNLQALWANYPAWSPTGDEIAFTSDIGTEYPNLRVVSPDHEPGTSTSTLARPPGLDWSRQTVEHISWSPTGEKFVLATYLTDGSVGQIWVFNINTDTWTALTNSAEGAYDPAWSPDGQWIVFAMREGGKTNLYVVSSDTTTWTDEYPTATQVTLDGASRSPAWSPDSTKIAYLGLQNTSFDIYVANFDVDANGIPALDSPNRLTENANIDAPSGLSWGR